MTIRPRWVANTSGKCPRKLQGTERRVKVRLRNGEETGPWPADGRHGLTWTLRGAYPFDVTHWYDDGADDDENTP